MKEWKKNQLVLYKKGDRFEIGKIKTITPTGAFVWYHSGETAAHTSNDNLYPIENAGFILTTSLGGEHDDL